MGVINQSADQYMCDRCGKTISALDMWRCEPAATSTPNDMCYLCFLDQCQTYVRDAIYRAGVLVGEISFKERLNK
jgi:hypothetical protein